MSVYIKDMEMPSCGLTVTIYPDGRVVQFLGYGEKKQLGTAIPVPDHGRLIDAEALQRVTIEQQSNDYNIKAVPRNWAYAFCAFEEIVADAPTIIPAEEGET